MTPPPPPSQNQEACPQGGQALAPTVMLPACGAVPEWGHRHNGIVSRPPTSRTF